MMAMEHHDEHREDGDEEDITSCCGHCDASSCNHVPTKRAALADAHHERRLIHALSGVRARIDSMELALGA
jgi:hypothetical protein